MVLRLGILPMPGYFAAIFEDITERKKSEKEIEHLASFPQLNPSPVIEMDPKGILHS